MRYLLFLAACIFACVSCHRAPSQDIVGSWHADGILPCVFAFSHDGNFQMLGVGGAATAIGAYTIKDNDLTLHPMGTFQGVTYQMRWTDADNFTMKPVVDKDTPPGQADQLWLKALTMQLHRLNKEEQLSQQTMDSEKDKIIPRPTPESESETCLHNVKQLTLGMTMYSQDYDEVYPTRSWQTAITPYVKDMSLFNCPARTRTGATDGYALSDALVGTKAQDIRTPATEPAIFDADLPGPSAIGSPSDLPKPTRHSKGNSMSYVDGHANFVP